MGHRTVGQCRRVKKQWGAGGWAAATEWQRWDYSTRDVTTMNKMNVVGLLPTEWWERLSFRAIIAAERVELVSTLMFVSHLIITALTDAWRDSINKLVPSHFSLISLIRSSCTNNNNRFFKSNLQEKKIPKIIRCNQHNTLAIVIESYYKIWYWLIYTIIYILVKCKKMTARFCSGNKLF